MGIPYTEAYNDAKEESVKQYPISVLANATFPSSGLSLNAGSGLMPLHRPSVSIEHPLRISKRPNLSVPDEGIHFLDGRFHFVVRVCRWDTKLEDQPVNFVHDQC
jgi:hypothetical protein